jgi:hypothetical protein
VNGDLISAIYAASSDDVWASVVFDQATRVVFLHWDGTTWTSVPVPGPQEFGTWTNYPAIDGSGPDDVWAGGYVHNTTTGRDTPQIAHLACGGR